MMKRSEIFIVMLCAFTTMNVNAAVVQRNSRSSISRTPTVSTGTTKATNTATATTTVVNQTESETITPQIIDTTPEAIIVENKSSQFDKTLNKSMSSNLDSSASDLSAMVRAQRAALDAESSISTKSAITAATNTCDSVLRTCMTEKCGNNFAKCASDTDTAFGTKLDSCRRNTKCTASEFNALSAEIKSDRASAIKLKSFNDIIDCGQSYDSCIIEQCGTKYSSCLGKSAGDRAISKCASIANKCKSMDSGLSSRTMNVFATLRQTAEKQISTDEKKLYSLRDSMRTACSRLGAMLDERSMDCVYTVGFYAGDDLTLYSSQKRYAGDTFDCTPNWFGVDVTTFMENAYRATRAQSSATSALLGSGLGIAAGAITSGAIDRAIETKKAEKELNKAECDTKQGMKWSKLLGKCVKDKGEKDSDETSKNETKKDSNESTNQESDQQIEQKQTRKERKEAEKDKCEKQPGMKWNKLLGKCVKNKGEDEKTLCEKDKYGNWQVVGDDAYCICQQNKPPLTWNGTACVESSTSNGANNSEENNSAQIVTKPVGNLENNNSDTDLSSLATEVNSSNHSTINEDTYNNLRAFGNLHQGNTTESIYTISGSGRNLSQAKTNWHTNAKKYMATTYCGSNVSTSPDCRKKTYTCPSKKYKSGVDENALKQDIEVICRQDTSGNKNDGWDIVVNENGTTTVKAKLPSTISQANSNVATKPTQQQEQQTNQASKQEKNCTGSLGTWIDNYSFCDCKYHMEPNKNQKCPNNPDIYDVRGVTTDSTGMPESAKKDWLQQAKQFMADKYCDGVRGILNCSGKSFSCSNTKVYDTTNGNKNFKEEIYILCDVQNSKAQLPQTLSSSFANTHNYYTGIVSVRDSKTIAQLMKKDENNATQTQTKPTQQNSQQQSVTVEAPVEQRPQTPAASTSQQQSSFAKNCPNVSSYETIYDIETNGTYALRDWANEVTCFMINKYCNDPSKEDVSVTKEYIWGGRGRMDCLKSGVKQSANTTEMSEMAATIYDYKTNVKDSPTHCQIPAPNSATPESTETELKPNDTTSGLEPQSSGVSVNIPDRTYTINENDISAITQQRQSTSSSSLPQQNSVGTYQQFDTPKTIFDIEETGDLQKAAINAYKKAVRNFIINKYCKDGTGSLSCQPNHSLTCPNSYIQSAQGEDFELEMYIYCKLEYDTYEEPDGQVTIKTKPRSTIEANMQKSKNDNSSTNSRNESTDPSTIYDVKGTDTDIIQATMQYMAKAITFLTRKYCEEDNGDVKCDETPYRLDCQKGFRTDVERQDLVEELTATCNNTLRTTQSIGGSYTVKANKEAVKRNLGTSQ